MAASCWSATLAGVRPRSLTGGPRLWPRPGRRRCADGFMRSAHAGVDDLVQPSGRARRRGRPSRNARAFFLSRSISYCALPRPNPRLIGRASSRSSSSAAVIFVAIAASTTALGYLHYTDQVSCHDHRTAPDGSPFAAYTRARLPPASPTPRAATPGHPPGPAASCPAGSPGSGSPIHGRPACAPGKASNRVARRTVCSSFGSCRRWLMIAMRQPPPVWAAGAQARRTASGVRPAPRWMYRRGKPVTARCQLHRAAPPGNCTAVGGQKCVPALGASPASWARGRRR